MAASSVITSDLVLSLLPIVLKFGPEFVKSIVDLIHQNPGLTHAEYVALIDKEVATAMANLDSIT